MPRLPVAQHRAIALDVRGGGTQNIFRDGFLIVERKRVADEIKRPREINRELRFIERLRGRLAAILRNLAFGIVLRIRWVRFGVRAQNCCGVVCVSLFAGQCVRQTQVARRCGEIEMAILVNDFVEQRWTIYKRRRGIVLAIARTEMRRRMRRLILQAQTIRTNVPQRPLTAGRRQIGRGEVIFLQIAHWVRVGILDDLIARVFRPRVFFDPLFHPREVVRVEERARRGARWQRRTGFVGDARPRRRGN